MLPHTFSALRGTSVANQYLEIPYPLRRNPHQYKLCRDAWSHLPILPSSDVDPLQPTTLASAPDENLTDTFRSDGFQITRNGWPPLCTALSRRHLRNLKTNLSTIPKERTYQWTDSCSALCCFNNGRSPLRLLPHLHPRC